MGIYRLKPAFRRKLQGLSDTLVEAGVSADALTATAVVLSALGGWSISRSGETSGLLWLVPILAMARITLNALDGLVAVAAGTARPRGEVLNEVGDRLSDMAWFIGLAYLVDSRLVLGTLAIVLLSSHVGVAIKAAGGERVYTGVMGKADRMVVLSLAAPLAFFFGARVLTYGVLMIGAGSVVTFLQRVRASRSQLG